MYVKYVQILTMKVMIIITYVIIWIPYTYELRSGLGKSAVRVLDIKYSSN